MQEEENEGLVTSFLMGCPIVLVLVLAGVILISVVGLTVLSSVGGSGEITTEIHNEAGETGTAAETSEDALPEATPEGEGTAPVWLFAV